MPAIRLADLTFAKDARDPSYVSWHQDLTCWGLAPPNVTTAWLALSPSKAENGCMRVIPGSHKQEIVDHRDTFARGNMPSRGQEIAVEFDHTRAVDLELEPGQMSLHHVKHVSCLESEHLGDTPIRLFDPLHRFRGAPGARHGGQRDSRARARPGSFLGRAEPGS